MEVLAMNAGFGAGVLDDLELEAMLQFGSRLMTLEEVLRLEANDVIEMDRHDSQPVDLIVGDRIVARGQVVLMNGNFAFRVSEVVTPQRRLETVTCPF